MEKLYLQMYSLGDHEPSHTLENIEKTAKMGYGGGEQYAAYCETRVEGV